MTIEEFLSYLRDRGIGLWVDGEDLRYSAPKGTLTQDLRAELDERRAEILAVLRETNGVVLAPHVDEAQPEKPHVAPRTPTEEILAKVWAEILGVEQVGVYDNFFELGGDSLLGLQVISKASQAGLRFVAQQILLHQSIAELAAVEGTAVQAEQGPVTGPVPLMTPQIKFFALDPPAPHHWNTAAIFETHQTLDPALMEKAVGNVLLHHDAMRLRFVHEGTTWHQFIAAPEEAIPLVNIDLSALPEAEQSPTIEAAATQLQTSLDLSVGPLLRVALFDLGVQQPGRFMIIINHLIVDGHSWEIILEDLFTAYHQLGRGESVQLPPKTTSFMRWVERLVEYAQTRELGQELAYWLELSWDKITRLPVDYPGGPFTETSVRMVDVSQSIPEAGALLQRTWRGPRSEQTTVTDVLLTALALALTRWTGTFACVIEMVGSGRWAPFDDVDLSRTVGWLSTSFPVLLDLEDANTPQDALRAVGEQLRRIPNHGFGYESLCYFSNAENAERLRTLPKPEVFFNYTGQHERARDTLALHGRASEAVGSKGDYKNVPHIKLDIGSFIAGDQLYTRWTYSKDVYRHNTIEKLVQDFMASLQSVISDLASGQVCP